jgi:hypothetical protein
MFHVEHCLWKGTGSRNLLLRRPILGKISGASDSWKSGSSNVFYNLDHMKCGLTGKHISVGIVPTDALKRRSGKS